MWQTRSLVLYSLPLAKMSVQPSSVALAANDWNHRRWLTGLVALSSASSLFAVISLARLATAVYGGRAMFRCPVKREVIWLILPVVICLSQRLSHACLSISVLILWNCEWLTKSVILYLMVDYYLDNRGNSRANTCAKSRLLCSSCSGVRIPCLEWSWNNQCWAPWTTTKNRCTLNYWHSSCRECSPATPAGSSWFGQVGWLSENLMWYLCVQTGLPEE